MKNRFRFLFPVLLISQVIYAQNQADSLRFEPPIKLEQSVNSDAEESLPLLSPDGKTLYFARTFDSQNIGGRNAGQDVWTSTKENDKWNPAQHAVEPLNSKGNDVVLGACRNATRLYILNHRIDEKSEKAGISVSDLNEGTGIWGAPQPVLIPGFEIVGHFYSAFISPEEDFMLITVPLEGDSLGNNIYISLSSDRGASWSTPASLGSAINTQADEISPFYDPSRKLLFFSRNRAADALDYDIYYSQKMSDTWKEWSTPIAINSVNSTGFDAYFMCTPAGEAYFSSSRNDGFSDIYFTKLKVEEPIDTLLADEPVPIDISEPVLIIETIDGTKTDRTLASMSKDELIAESTNIRFVYFDFDKYTISKRYFEVLDDANKILDQYPELNLRIEGHTDAVGTEAYNQELSSNRAESVKEFMVLQGMDPARIETVGFGKSRPLSTNYTDEGRAKNRRVELFFREAK